MCHSRPFYKVGYDLMKDVLSPVQIECAEPREVSLAHGRFEVRNRVALHPGTGTTTINIHVHAILAIERDKIAKVSSKCAE
jgi:hypothetical protein